MKLYKSLQRINKIENSVITIGMFDGVHLGHKCVIERVIEIAKERNQKSILITFSNSPSTHFSKNNNDSQLTNKRSKINLLKKMQLDHLFILEFNEYLANLNAFSFVNNILIKLLKVNCIVFGYDNHFGKNREGTYQFIIKNFPTIHAELINASTKDKIAISTTRIKEKILEGDIYKANQLLGYNYAISGIVVKGMQLGRKLGFPTANIVNQATDIIPKNGVYFTLTKLYGNTYLSVTNIGTKPTINNGNTVFIETHILDFKKSIYGKKIEITFLERIRNEIKFNQISELTQQIMKDIGTVRKLYSLHITT